MENSEMNEGWFALFGAALVLIGSIIREVINNRCKIKLERIKIHDKDKLEAYKKLFNFARGVINTYYPLANNEISDFTRMMKGQFEQEIKPHLLYYSPQILKILDEYDGMYFDAMNRSDLSEESDKQLQKFISEGFFESALKLRELIKKESSLL
jgi:hypothetical protein